MRGKTEFQPIWPDSIFSEQAGSVNWVILRTSFIQNCEVCKAAQSRYRQKDMEPLFKS